MSHGWKLTDDHHQEVPTYKEVIASKGRKFKVRKLSLWMVVPLESAKGEMAVKSWYENAWAWKAAVEKACVGNLSILSAVLSHSVLSDSFLSMRILQARILEWVATPSSRESSQPRDWTQVSCIAGGFFTSWGTREAQHKIWDNVSNRWIEIFLISI